jgi:hypothetical protein
MGKIVSGDAGAELLLAEARARLDGARAPLGETTEKGFMSPTL